jgi:hypothetical protein
MRSVFLLTAALLLTASFLAISQSPPDGRVLFVVGQSGYAKILELNGKSYVGVEDVARLTQGSLSFAGNRVLLTLATGPASRPSVAPPLVAPSPAAPQPPATKGFSKAFLQAGIEQMSAIREWRITVVNSIKNNSPISEDWIAQLQGKAQKNLALVAAARSTEDDRNGYTLLAGEFANMRKLSDRFLSKRRKLLYINPDSINNDPLDQQIVACGRSLASMAADNQFRDEAACSER